MMILKMRWYDGINCDIMMISGKYVPKSNKVWSFVGISEQTRFFCATYHLPLWWHDKLWCLTWSEYWWWCMCCEDDVISVEGSGGLFFNQVSSAAVIRDCRALHWRWVASGCETKTRHRVCQKIKITKETRPRFSTSCVFVFIPLF